MLSKVKTCKLGVLEKVSFKYHQPEGFRRGRLIPLVLNCTHSLQCQEAALRQHTVRWGAF